MDDDKRTIRVQITEQQLLCKNHCGFYGTPQWNGLCSHCWRISQQEKKKVKDFQKNKVLLSQESLENNNERRKISENSSTILPITKHSTLKSFLPKSPSLFSSTTLSFDAQSTSFNNRPPSPDSTNSQQNFQQYLIQTFGANFAKDFEKHCDNFLDRIFNYWTMSHDDEAKRDSIVSEMTQLLYREMQEKIQRLKIPTNDFKLSDFMMQLESFVCIQVYTVLFCSRSDEEMEDLNFQERVRSLHWVTFGFLETSLDFSSNKVQDYLDDAVTEIVDLNSYREISKKLDCLIRCCDRIFDALKESRSGAPASADEFLPVLIYVILKANPPLIQSNLKFISRFALSYRIMRGESGYYYTNLSCALQFIQDMNAESLRLTNEEFCDYTNGRRVAPTRNSVSTSVVKSIEGSLKRIDEILEGGKEIEKKMDEFSKKIDDDSDNFKNSVKKFLEDHSFNEFNSITINNTTNLVVDNVLNNSLIKLDDEENPQKNEFIQQQQQQKQQNIIESIQQEQQNPQQLKIEEKVIE